MPNILLTPEAFMKRGGGGILDFNNLDSLSPLWASKLMSAYAVYVLEFIDEQFDSTNEAVSYTYKILNNRIEDNVL